jgi:nucleoside-diphosphate-sugar epimerase
MTITVLGARGFVGSRLVERLRSAGERVETPDRRDEGSPGRDPGRIIYCAGLTADYAQRPFETVEAHVGLLARILAAGRFEHLVYLSSTRLYDSLGGAVVDETTRLALDPANPRHLYDLTKALGENLCLTTAPERTAVARLSCVVDATPDAPGFLPDWIRLARLERAITLDSAPGFQRDYITRDDAVAALMALCSRATTGIVNVAGGETVSNGDLAEVFTSRGIATRFTREVSPPPVPLCRIERLKQLGITPVPIRQALARWLDAEGP